MKKAFDWLMIGMYIITILLIIAAFVTIKTIKSEGGKCVMNPIQFGVDTVGRAKHNQIMCTCSNMEEFSEAAIFTTNFTK